jgi:hypothetical protein
VNLSSCYLPTTVSGASVDFGSSYASVTCLLMLGSLGTEFSKLIWELIVMVPADKKFSEVLMALTFLETFHRIW